MDAVGLLAILLVPVLLLALWWTRRRREVVQTDDGESRLQQRYEAVDTIAGWPPEATPLLTRHERLALKLLEESLPDHMILAQVPLARFLRVPTRNSYAEWVRRVGQFCADLVVCNSSARVIAVVEIRRVHQGEGERTRKRHLRMDRVLRKAGVRVVVWNEGDLPKPEKVRDQVLGTSEPGDTPPAAAPPQSTAAPTPAPPAPPPPVAPLPFFNTGSSPDEVIEVDEPPVSALFDESRFAEDAAPAPAPKKRR
jgi:hypothetical protein